MLQREQLIQTGGWPFYDRENEKSGELMEVKEQAKQFGNTRSG